MHDKSCIYYVVSCFYNTIYGMQSNEIHIMLINNRRIKSEIIFRIENNLFSFHIFTPDFEVSF